MCHFQDFYCTLVRSHTVPEQELNIRQKMTIWKLGLFLLKTTLTFCQVIILLYTMSQAHKVIYASLKSISGQHSASFHMVIENVADIFFPKGALLERCVQFLLLVKFQ